ncbi:hypothetical protein [Deinococcus multiflagellatus]|uniref:DUF7832 domain-containing protein n=1 Tax=Deinococcus multiflagellatus TaxID=1656887 RepID=A0ABW1ZJV0_9DEIO|nr:hypothetical protein [Deinococcus multiflagellatus]MBZ9712578.1 hypothetical protein [Deinococcus multiflagellatus]
MDRGICYDKAKWHYDGDFPPELPPSQGFVHTGMFLSWLASRDLLADALSADAEAIRTRQHTGAQVFQRWVGVLTSDMLTAEGNAFARHYYASEAGAGEYLHDYFNLFDDLPSVYHVPDTWENAAQVLAVMDERYAEWQAGRSDAQSSGRGEE